MIGRPFRARGALAGVLALGGLVIPEAATVFFVVPTLLAAAYVTVYSFVAHRRRRTT